MPNLTLLSTLKVDEEQYRKILEMIDSGKTEGANLQCGGGRPAGSAKGYYIAPTVFSDVGDDMRIAR